MCPRCNSIKIRILASTRHEERGELDTPVVVVVVVGGVVEGMEIWRGREMQSPSSLSFINFSDGGFGGSGVHRIVHGLRATGHGPLFTQLSFTFIPLVHRFSEYELLRARWTWGGSFRSFLLCVYEEVLPTGYETGHTDQLELRTQIWVYLIRTLLR